MNGALGASEMLDDYAGTGRYREFYMVLKLSQYLWNSTKKIFRAGSPDSKDRIWFG
jgi:hypothetical protein